MRSHVLEVETGMALINVVAQALRELYLNHFLKYEVSLSFYSGI